MSAAVDRRGDGRDVTGFVDDVLIVFQLQCFHSGSILTDTSPDIGTGMYHDHIRAHLADLFLYAPLRSLSDGKHRDYGGNADDDAEHRQESAQLVVGKGTEGYFYEVCSVHFE